MKRFGRPETYLWQSHILLVLVLGTLIWVVAGCGGGSESDPDISQEGSGGTVSATSAMASEQSPPTIGSQSPAIGTPAAAPPGSGYSDSGAAPASDPMDLAPAPAPVGTVAVYESSVTLPAYPTGAYESDMHNPVFNWPYARTDLQRFAQDQPSPEDRTYRLLVLENAYLKVTILPELGGRIWQAIHKPTGTNMFYQNAEVRPTSQGPAEQQGRILPGGMEWNLPVADYGYDWGTEWGYIPLQHTEDLASVTVFTPRDGRYLNASISISLLAGSSSFEVAPTITNLSSEPVAFAYWHTAVLAPGKSNRLSELVQVIPGASAVAVDLSEEPRLPGVGEIVNWPVYQGADLAWLDNWTGSLGFVEHPAAQGPFAAVYDHRDDAGAVRIYPADVVRGSRIFASDRVEQVESNQLSERSGTGNDFVYVELQGGLMPTYDDTYQLPAGGTVNWREIWYPVHSTGGVTYADEVAALHVRVVDGGLRVAVYPTRPMDGTLITIFDGQEIGRQSVRMSPDAPFNDLVAGVGQLPGQGSVRVRFEDEAGRTYFDHVLSGISP